MTTTVPLIFLHTGTEAWQFWNAASSYEMGIRVRQHWKLWTEFNPLLLMERESQRNRNTAPAGRDEKVRQEFKLWEGRNEEN